jgi:hypothetical protein
LAAPIAAFVAITQTAGGTGQNPERLVRRSPLGRRRKRRAEAAAEDGEGRLFCFAMQSAPVGSLACLLIACARRKIAGRSHCRPEPLGVRSPSRRPWSRALPALAQSTTDPSRSIERCRLFPRPAGANARSERHLLVRVEAATLLGALQGLRCALKSPSRGDNAIASTPASSARWVRLACTASPAASASRAI